MAGILRGEIRRCYIEAVEQVVGHEQGGPRPVLILSRDGFNASSQLVIAALITSVAPRRPYPWVVPIESVKMPATSWVLVSQVRTLSVERLGDLLGRVSDEEMEKVQRELFQLLLPR